MSTERKARFHRRHPFIALLSTALLGSLAVYLPTGTQGGSPEDSLARREAVAGFAASLYTPDPLSFGESGHPLHVAIPDRLSETFPFSSRIQGTNITFYSESGSNVQPGAAQYRSIEAGDCRDFGIDSDEDVTGVDAFTDSRRPDKIDVRVFDRAEHTARVCAPEHRDVDVIVAATTDPEPLTLDPSRTWQHPEHVISFESFAPEGGWDAPENVASADQLRTDMEQFDSHFVFAAEPVAGLRINFFQNDGYTGAYSDMHTTDEDLTNLFDSILTAIPQVPNSDIRTGVEDYIVRNDYSFPNVLVNVHISLAGYSQCMGNDGQGFVERPEDRRMVKLVCDQKVGGFISGVEGAPNVYRVTLLTPGEDDFYSNEAEAVAGRSISQGIAHELGGHMMSRLARGEQDYLTNTFGDTDYEHGISVNPLTRVIEEEGTNAFTFSYSY